MGINVRVVLGNCEYLVPITDDLKFYTGFHLGNTKFQTKDFTYGAQTGFLYDITKNIEFEIGYAYTKYDANVKMKGKIDTNTPYGTLDFIDEIDFGHSDSIFAGLNYKF